MFGGSQLAPVSSDQKQFVWKCSELMKPNWGDGTRQEVEGGGGGGGGGGSLTQGGSPWQIK